MTLADASLVGQKEELIMTASDGKDGADVIITVQHEDYLQRYVTEVGLTHDTILYHDLFISEKTNTCKYTVIAKLNLLILNCLGRKTNCG